MTSNKITNTSRSTILLNSILPIKSIIHSIHRTSRISQSRIITSLITNNNKPASCSILINRTRTHSRIIIINICAFNKSTIFNCQITTRVNSTTKLGFTINENSIFDSGSGKSINNKCTINIRSINSMAITVNGKIPIYENTILISDSIFSSSISNRVIFITRIQLYFRPAAIYIIS